ncbi:coiled-coil domain-containing protein 103-like [Copidosoma floridanum]|uniref:coiled-coil domain-containing protein 103-like n=1 Tax=Copidosoma floridanum TaxID=29053 RepID=UPI0006C975A3|nr:coiled-coil domain-containing protein 103-like [Copidosoma floridanum]
MSILKKPVDFESLESELEDALKTDELYKVQNDAKLRAMEQRVPTYDHFRGMVLTAHLKPLDRSELQRKAQVSWNRACNDGAPKFEAPPPSREVASKGDSSGGISSELLAAWKSLADSPAKFELLVRHKDSLRDKYFKVEVPSDFLRDALKVCFDVCGKGATVPEVVGVLEAFAECGRFSLSLAMIPASERPCVKHLFEKLLDAVDNRPDMSRVNRLVVLYCITQKKDQF